MSADDLVRIISDVLFAVVFVAAVGLALRHRRRAAIDAALMFGSLSFVVLQGELFRILGIKLPELLGEALVVVLLAVPYLFLRLVDDLTVVPRTAMRLALAAFVVTSVALIATTAPYPPVLIVAVILYFGLAEIYGAILLVRESFRATAVLKRRAQAAALGSLLLGVALLVAGVPQLLPDAAPLIQSLTRVLVLLSATAYVLGIATPGFLKRAWLEPELRHFLARVAAIPPDAQPERIVEDLASRVSQTLGAMETHIALASGGRALGSGQPLEVAAALTEAEVLQRPVMASIGAAGRREALLAAPVTARGRRIGALAARLRRPPLFADDELELVALLADQAALILDGSRLYADLAAANRQLSDATRAKSEFLANMSHELRTPLNAILGFSDLLVEQLDERLTSSQRRYFNNIRDAGHHLLDLINEVLDLSKVEAGRLEIRPESIRLSSLLDPVVASTRSAAVAAGQDFVDRVSGDVLVRVDPGRMRQIMYNLLSNAVKFTPQGGQVELRAEANGQDLYLQVADTGMGIPVEKKDRVFGTFERLHEGRSEASGTGLGLALTKKLVELHGGTIGFESTESVGSTFFVLIPAVVIPAVTGPRILVVEDEQRDAELLAALAGRLGAAVELVGTAASARDAIDRSAPLAIILDLRLPDGRGEDLLAELKNDPRRRAIPVLVVSVEDDEGRSRPLGADDHLTKPIDRERVTAWIERTLAQSGRMATLAS